jgi:nucleoside-diphosphate-sugar epimerase
MADGTPTVLLTGASGQIGSGFRDDYVAHYAGDYHLRLAVHNRAKLGSDDRFSDVVELDITDYGSVERACRGVDVVVHLAASPDWRGDFCDELHRPNVIGAYHVFEAAKNACCRRVIYASSVHAIMGHAVDRQARETDAARPDTMYGVTKAFGEALCSSFAYESHLSCIAIRIGAYVPAGELERVTNSANPHLLDIVITQRDMSQLIHRCIVAPDSVKYAIVHGVSNNRFNRLGLEETRALLGYEPQDDAFAISKLVQLGPEEKV